MVEGDAREQRAKVLNVGNKGIMNNMNVTKNHAHKRVEALGRARGGHHNKKNPGSVRPKGCVRRTRKNAGSTWLTDAARLNSNL